MSEHSWLGMAIIFLSGTFNGSFALPMKYSRQWRWENTWLVYTAFALLLFPCLLAAVFVPKLQEVYRGLPGHTLWSPLLFGFLWGVAVVTYGLGIRAVGIALAVAVVAGLSCLSGPLVPLLVLSPADLFRSRGIFLLLSLPILLLGLTLYGAAGIRREKEQAAADSIKGAATGRFRTGLVIVIFTGIFGANWNLGFAFSGDILRRSIELGANQVTSTYVVWTLVLGAGFVPNLLYCLYLLFRNQTWPLFRQAGWAREMMLGIAMALLWIAGIVGYGIGATLVGKYGTSVGFVLFAAATVLSSNALGVVTGEWKSTSRRTRRLLAGAVAAILVSVVVLNLGGLF